MDDDAGMKIPTDEFLGGIEFDDVRFTYPNGREDVVSLSITPFKILFDSCTYDNN